MTFDPSATRSGGHSRPDEPRTHPALLCYINGVEVPIADISVTPVTGQPPQYEITLIDDPELPRLNREDRVPALVFYLDRGYDSAFPVFRLLVDGLITV